MVLLGQGEELHLLQVLDQVVEVGMQGREHFEARTSLVELCLLPLLVEAGDKGHGGPASDVTTSPASWTRE